MRVDNISKRAAIRLLLQPALAAAAAAAASAPALAYSAMKSLNNCDQFDGLDSPGGGFRTIWNNALVGWMSRYGGLPSPSSIAVMPENTRK